MTTYVRSPRAVPTSRPARTAMRRGPAPVVTQRVADERPDGAQRRRGEVQDARDPVDDDDREGHESGERARGHPSSTNRSVDWLNTAVASIYRKSSVGGVATSTKSVTCTRPPSSTLTIIASG